MAGRRWRNGDCANVRRLLRKHPRYSASALLTVLGIRVTRKSRSYAGQTRHRSGRKGIEVFTPWEMFRGGHFTRPFVKRVNERLSFHARRTQVRHEWFDGSVPYCRFLEEIQKDQPSSDVMRMSARYERIGMSRDTQYVPPASRYGHIEFDSLYPWRSESSPGWDDTVRAYEESR
jgi:hypothetical protein